MSGESEKGIKWWLRFVVFGSGGLAVIILTLISLKCNSKTAVEIKPSDFFMGQSIIGSKISAKNSSVNIININSETEKISKSKGSVPVAPEREINGRSRFFRFDYATLALLPGIRMHSEAVNAGTFLILTPGKQYRLKELKPPLWLQFNHHLSDTNGARRHLGIMVVTFGNMGSIMPLEVYRNKKWVRPNNKKILGQFTEVVDLPWTEFKVSAQKWASPDAKLEESDKIVKGPWQAIPEGGNKTSWEFRKFWQWAADNCQRTAKSALGREPNFDNVKVPTRLIRYNSIRLLASKSPVIFDIRSIRGDEAAVFIAIYALEDSGQDITYWYWITSEN